MLLATVSSIRDELGFDDMANINYAIIAALHAAEAQVGALLRTDFKRQSNTDLFRASAPGFVEGDYYETKFRLTQGQIQTVSSVLFSDSFDMSSPTSSTTHIVNADIGQVTVVGVAFNRQFVQITYTSGFEAAQSDPTSYKLSQVPNWLQEAAKLRALITLASNPAVKDANAGQDVTALQEQFDNLIAVHNRYTPSAILPIR